MLQYPNVNMNECIHCMCTTSQSLSYCPSYATVSTLHIALFPRSALPTQDTQKVIQQAGELSTEFTMAGTGSLVLILSHGRMLTDGRGAKMY